MKIRSLLKSVGRRTSVLSRQAEPLFESLEPRSMMDVAITSALPDIVVAGNSAPTNILLTGHFEVTGLYGTIVKYVTNVGSFNVELFDQTNPGATRTTPLTVANFLDYVNSGAYTDVIFHRAIPNFVIQGGGFALPTASDTEPGAIPTNPAVTSEAGNSNIRGTIAMALNGSPSDPNSGTNQWFFNLVNNGVGTDNDLDTQNFTAFGHVIGNGMTVVDAISNLPRFNFGSPFDDLPLTNYTNSTPVTPANFVNISSITVIGKYTITVASSNAALVAPTLSGEGLSLTYGANQAGSATVTVTITAADGTSAVDSFNVTVGASPKVAQLNTNPGTLLTKGGLVTLTALGVSSPNGAVTKVQFYRDTNNSGGLEVGQDTLLFEDTFDGNGWSTSLSSSSFDFGYTRFFARAIDSAGGISTPVSAVVRLNTSPTVSSLTANPTDIQRNTSFTLNALGVTDPDGYVARVEFWRDTNNNGTFDPGSDTLLGTDNKPSDGFSLTTKINGLATGNNNFFARPVDNYGVFGAAVKGVVNVINASPLTPTLTLDKSRLATLGQKLTLVATNISDPDGTVKQVKFYLDDGDGVFDATKDILLGADASSAGGWSLTVPTNTTGFKTGTNRYFVVAIDNLGKSSAAGTKTNVINAAATIASLTSNPLTPVARTTSVTLTANTVADSDGTVKNVEFWYDKNNNGTLETGIDTLLGTSTGGAGGYKLTINPNTLKLPAGDDRFFARAQDNDSSFGAVSPLVMTINNVVPVTPTFTSTPSVVAQPGDNVTLKVTNPSDPDGKIVKVQFYRDNGDNNFSTSADALLGQATSAVNGAWSVTIPTTGFPIGSQHFWAVAIDNDGGLSVAASAFSRVNALPDTAFITDLSTTISRSSSVQIEISAADSDGLIRKVELLRDSNGSNTLNSGDAVIATAVYSNNNWLFTFNGTALSVGSNLLFLRVTDNDGGVSIISTHVTAA